LGHFLIILFSQKKKKQKKLQNSYEILAQRNEIRPAPARAKSQNAMKAWATKLIARLGHIRPKTLWAVHLRWTVTRDSRREQKPLSDRFSHKP
jgi:hypothetical protein